MQLLSSFCGYSHEFVDCRGTGRDDANHTWSAACPPPFVPLMRGLPEPRHAPALEELQGPASLCSCSMAHGFVNCAGNTEALFSAEPAAAAELAQPAVAQVAQTAAAQVVPPPLNDALRDHVDLSLTDGIGW